MELTREDVKALYEHGMAMSQSGSLPYAAQLLETVAASGQPLFTGYALSELVQVYRKLRNEGLEMGTIKRIAQLSEEQRKLLEPKWIAACYEKTGDLKAARSVLTALMTLTPDDPAVFGALAEVSLLEGNVEEAGKLADRLILRGEAMYQVLGRMVKAFSLALGNRPEQSAAELSWIGQYLVSVGSIPGQSWDYRDLQNLLSKMGTNTKAATLLINVLLNKVTSQEFAQAWTEAKSPVALMGT